MAQVSIARKVLYIKDDNCVFPEQNCNPPVEDINGKFQGGRVKVVGIPGGKPKIEEKTWISRAVQCKITMINYRGVTVNLRGDPGESTSNKSISSRVQFFFWKSSY